MKEKEKKMINDVHVFVQAHALPFNAQYRMCIDGRYASNDAAGIAIPGGDTGLVLALAQMYAPEKAYTYVTTFLQENGVPFCSHTDEHEGTESCITGCGHINAAIISNARYDIKERDALTVLGMVCKNAHEKNSHTHHVVLQGGHHEKAILINTSTTMTIAPQDAKKDVQYFVYDKAMHQTIVRDLCQYCKKKHNVDIDPNQLWQIASSQAQTTLGLLGSSKGKPIFRVDAANPDSIALAGYAPSL